MITVRASSWSDLFDCPARWYARNIEGRRIPLSGAAHLGSSLHIGTGVFDDARLRGDPIGVDDAAGVLVDALHNPVGEVNWEDLGNARKVEPIALSLHGRYCREIAPHREYIAVEALCEALDIRCEGITVRLTGTTDRIRRSGADGYGITDLKSGARAVDGEGRAVTKGHGLQLAVYELLAEQVIGKKITTAAEVIGMQTTKQARIGTGRVEAARETLIGTEERPGMLEHAAGMMRAGMFHGNPRSNLCSERYCPVYGECHYR